MKPLFRSPAERLEVALDLYSPFVERPDGSCERDPNAGLISRDLFEFLLTTPTGDSDMTDLANPTDTTNPTDPNVTTTDPGAELEAAVNAEDAQIADLTAKSLTLSSIVAALLPVVKDGEAALDTVNRLVALAQQPPTPPAPAPSPAPALVLATKLAVRDDLNAFMRTNPSYNVQDSVLHVFQSYERELAAAAPAGAQ